MLINKKKRNKTYYKEKAKPKQRTKHKFRRRTKGRQNFSLAKADSLNPSETDHILGCSA